jgi:hypothetical protein
MSIKKKVYVAYTNTELNEGRGKEIPLVVCETEATAMRLGKGRYVQGADCPVHGVEAINMLGTWYFPATAVNLISPTPQDATAQTLLDMRNLAIQKAKEAGLSDDEITAIGLSRR